MEISIDDIKLAPENAIYYRPITLNSVADLIDSMEAHGVLEPLVLSEDGYLISGHRRLKAARHASNVKTIPIRTLPISYEDDHEKFLELLVHFNTSRDKSDAEKLNEVMAKLDPLDAHANLKEMRKVKTKLVGADLSRVNALDIGVRYELTDAKMPLLRAVLRILDENKDYWPLTVRQVHYRLLGPQAPLTHASKPDSRYVNDNASYQKAIDICTRGRLAGYIPWEALEDETRPVERNAAFYSLEDFLTLEIPNILSGYWRDLLQSQSAHIEIIAEKLTVRSILASVAREHTIPLTITRGMSSLPPKKEIADRFAGSGKERMIILAVSDLDPAGDSIAEDIYKSFRRDFSIAHDKLDVFKVAVTIEQVRSYGLAPSMDAKPLSPTYTKFCAKYGITSAYELEAFAPTQLAGILRDAVEQVIDQEAFDAELEREQAESVRLAAIQNQIRGLLANLNLPSPEGGPDEDSS